MPSRARQWQEVQGQEIGEEVLEEKGEGQVRQEEDSQEEVPEDVRHLRRIEPAPTASRERRSRRLEQWYCTERDLDWLLLLYTGPTLRNDRRRSFDSLERRSCLYAQLTLDPHRCQTAAQRRRSPY